MWLRRLTSDSGYRMQMVQVSLPYLVEFYLTDVIDPSLPMADPMAQTAHQHSMGRVTSRPTVHRGPWVHLTQVEGIPRRGMPPIPIPPTGTYMFPERSICPLTALLTLARKSATIISPFISPPWSTFRRSCYTKTPECKRHEKERRPAKHTFFLLFSVPSFQREHV